MNMIIDYKHLFKIVWHISYLEIYLSLCRGRGKYLENVREIWNDDSNHYFNIFHRHLRKPFHLKCFSFYFMREIFSFIIKPFYILLVKFKQDKVNMMNFKLENLRKNWDNITFLKNLMLLYVFVSLANPWMLSSLFLCNLLHFNRQYTI